MEKNFTSLDDYNNGFLGGEQEGAAELLKAMQAGQITGRDTADQALTVEPLKAESLEKTLKLLEFRTQDIRLLNAMPKMVAYNTVEEFLQLKSYGTDRGGFYNEGELSDVEDSTYVRRAELIKYIQVTGEITMQAQMVRTNFIDVYRKEVENKTMWIMRRANTSLTKADAEIIPQEFNGLYKQHANIGTGGNDFLYSSLEEYFNAAVVVDLRGKSLTQKNVENAAVTVDNGFGTPTDLFGPNTVISALMQDYFNSQRIVMPSGGFNGVIGTVVQAIDTSINKIKLNSDKFMKNDPARTTADNATSAKAPAAPVAVGVTVTADTLSKLRTGENGTVYYAISSVNRYGESALTLISGSAVTLAVGSSVDLEFTQGAGANPTSGYKIYRTKVTSAVSATGLQFYPIFKVSTSQLAAGYDGAVATKIRDRHRFLPGLEQAFLTQMDDEVLSFKQLAPISKLDLAVISMSRRFIAFNFCTPQMYAPKKFVRFINASPVLAS